MGPDYADNLIESARQKKLHEETYWHILLHYTESLWGSKSAIDDPKFFLAPDGKYNPQSELEATIRSFFREKNQDETEHPVCRFLGRYQWLKEKLNIDEFKLPVTRCGAFERIVDEIGPKSASIAFPTYYINSPASMFGHTLLCIGTDYKSGMLSHAVNYSAITQESGGFLFGVKGIFGVYKGYYSTLPYYKKIQEYSDIAQRDIWEYRLNLTEAEIRKMLAHLWELREISSDYYYLDENCSYNLLFLLESARPSLRLTSEFPLWVLPIDTVKAMKEQGLIDSVEYRPSKATKIRHKISLLSDKSRDIAPDIATGKADPEAVLSLDADTEEKIRIADLAAEYIQYQYAQKHLSKAEYQDIFLKTLRIRSKLGKSEKELYTVPQPPRPDEVHESNRFSMGLGINDDRFFQEITYRPALTDLTDTDYGYKQGIEIEFCAANLRYYRSDDVLELEALDLVDVVSISPADKFFMPYSWKFNTGLHQKIMADGDESLIFNLSSGRGLALYHDSVGLVYGFIEAALNIGGSLEGSYALGAGGSVGILKSVRPWWKCHLSAKRLYFELGDTHCADEAELSQNIRLSRNHSIRLNLSWERAFDSSQTEAGVSWNMFF
jgi:hypothetical protein